MTHRRTSGAKLFVLSNELGIPLKRVNTQILVLLLYIVPIEFDVSLSNGFNCVETTLDLPVAGLRCQQFSAMR